MLVKRDQTMAFSQNCEYLRTIDRKHGSLKVKVTSRHVYLFNTPNSRLNIEKNMNEVLLSVTFYGDVSIYFIPIL